MKQLGSNLRTARIRRELTIKQVAESIGTGPRAVMDAEKGKSTTGLVVYTALLWKYLLLDKMHELADPLRDEIGLICASKREPKRATRARGVEEVGVPSVYFIGDTKRGIVKIGKSNKPVNRFESLQAANAGPLQLLAELPFETDHAAWTAESELHAKYKYLNTHGEWFRLDSSLNEEILGIRARSLRRADFVRPE